MSIIILYIILCIVPKFIMGGGGNTNPRGNPLIIKKVTCMSGGRAKVPMPPPPKIEPLHCHCICLL